MFFKGLLLCTLAVTDENSQHNKKMSEFLNKNPRKMNQKQHQKINNFYFIYKSPRVILVAAESTRNDI